MSKVNTDIQCSDSAALCSVPTCYIKPLCMRWASSRVSGMGEVMWGAPALAVAHGTMSALSDVTPLKSLSPSPHDAAINPRWLGGP